MPLFESFELNVEQANSAIKKAFAPLDADLGALLKSSQNRTYKGTLTTTTTTPSSKKSDDEASATGSAAEESSSVIFRVTPYTPEKAEQIALEYEFLLYLKEKGLSCCAPIVVPQQSLHNKGLQWIEYVDTQYDKKLIICAFEFAAEGSPVNFMQYTWVTEEERVTALGRWFGTFHTLSQQFILERHPDMLSTSSFTPQLMPQQQGSGGRAPVNTYATNLSGTLQNEPIDEIDLGQKESIHKFGLLHGDVNVSNFFTRDKDAADGSRRKFEPIMFDFDQIQLGWYAFDLSQPFWGIIVAIDANYGGMELPASITPTTIGDFGRKLIRAYSETFFHVSVSRDDTVEVDGATARQQFTLTKPTEPFDWAQLRRMIKLRRMQYKNFCTQAVVELEKDDKPASAMMKAFCQFISDYINKEGNEARIDALLNQLNM